MTTNKVRDVFWLVFVHLFNTCIVCESCQYITDVNVNHEHNICDMRGNTYGLL